MSPMVSLGLLTENTSNRVINHQRLRKIKWAGHLIYKAQTAIQRTKHAISLYSTSNHNAFVSQNNAKKISAYPN